MSKIVLKIVADVDAALATIDLLVASIVREQLGPESTWTNATASRVPQLALQYTDGRAG
jgi:hypothetical protein